MELSEKKVYTVLQFKGSIKSFYNNSYPKPKVMLKTRDVEVAKKLRATLNKKDGFNSKDERYIYTIKGLI